ncbi:hypothetical protein CWB55_04000 [Staphylococcus hominis]|uniref:hypothetical protein n=2 Tax=Staphylococcus hominis TaxID=1290 RepID=UPI000C25EB4F|nr:hypothetical protein [Staphylococcus hominis]PJM33537.1 hypothetical protein CWC34_03450 [Staphylococcus hominis]PJM56749.1 hypothetical protein CWB55_04000 [Staphylococcus hominis]
MKRMNNTNIRMVEITYSDSNKNTDKFKEFLNLSEEILISFQKQETELVNEIEWINENFIALINELSVLKDDEFKNSLLNMAIAEMKLLLNYQDVHEIAFNFIDLVISIDDKVKYLNNKQMSENLNLLLNGYLQHYDKYTNLERAS